MATPHLGHAVDLNIKELHDQVLFASCNVRTSPLCPNGVFSPAVAVDRDEKTAVLRATYEAAERYALAAISGEHEFSVCNDEDSIIRPILRMRDPFARNSGDPIKVIRITDTVGEAYKFAAVADVFAPYPINIRECSWHPSTNGVAVGSTYRDARERSLVEYVERHSIMKLWYFGSACRFIKLSLFSDHLKPELMYLDEMGYELFAFEVSTSNLLNVVLIIGLQKDGYYPYAICAAGASTSAIDAARRAIKETIQTLVASVFLAPKLSAWISGGQKVRNIDERILYYGNPLNAKIVKSKIEELIAHCAGEFFDDNLGLCSAEELISSLDASAAFFDISPKSWMGQLYCVRCLSSTLLPLIIDETLLNDGALEMQIKSVAMPHPFP